MGTVNGEWVNGKPTFTKATVDKQDARNAGKARWRAIFARMRNLLTIAALFNAQRRVAHRLLARLPPVTSAPAISPTPPSPPVTYYNI